MGAKLKAIFVFLFLSAVFLHSKTYTFAAPPDCSVNFSGFSVTGNWPAQTVMNASYSPLKITFNNIPAGVYKINCSTEANLSYYDYNSYRNIAVTNVGSNGRGTLEWNIAENSCFTQQSGMSNASDWPSFVKIELENNSSSACTAFNYNLLNASKSISCSSSNISFSSASTSTHPGCFESGESMTWNINNVVYDGGLPVTGSLNALATNGTISSSNVSINNGVGSGSVTLGSAGQNFLLSFKNVGGSNILCSSTIPIRAVGGCLPGTNPDVDTTSFNLCKQTANNDDLEECGRCFEQTPPAIWTAFGCIPTSKEGIVVSFIRIGLGISGGFVLLSILYGAFLITTSSGDPKRVQEGQEMVTSAVMGLLFVIFSIIILRFIGVSLLQIPGFGT